MINVLLKQSKKYHLFRSGDKFLDEFIFGASHYTVSVWLDVVERIESTSDQVMKGPFLFPGTGSILTGSALGRIVGYA